MKQSAFMCVEVQEIGCLSFLRSPPLSRPLGLAAAFRQINGFDEAETFPSATFDHHQNVSADAHCAKSYSKIICLSYLIGENAQPCIKFSTVQTCKLR